ncbi:BatA domain-containing protein [Microbulbifer sp.]|uniref:BatA domain-containing protein n=1 Tax=Microbulbifer sp. TaxID=1908541 RepID=UPI003F37E187
MFWQSSQWLWLLAALAIPLLIHLLRRNATREITFAAVHWLQRERQHKKRLLLREKWLLLLRMLLLALLAILLAGPLLQRDNQASEKMLLVDPRIERAELETFLGENPRFASVLWLLPDPLPISESRPQAPDLWRTLSSLADAGEFRRAHILLRHAQNPSGHGALAVSPHWRWHALENGSKEESSPLPRLTLLGQSPTWLEAVLQQLQNTVAPQLELQKLAAAGLASASEQDWLLYDTAGELPAALQQFIRDGGLLITDQRVQPAGGIQFVEIAGDEPLQAAALGRGSWLRYGRDWHNADFFHRPELPEKLWQQWFAQDWALQARGRGLWSIDAPPGIAIADAEVHRFRLMPIEQWLLLAFVLLLALERTVALARPAVGSDGHD